ncbi:hypothetical protein BD309DRAFT_920726 [Dichomitus squalens]|nr:hypothetical protein BD309DRAFT_920726 [Dichomitus squalens]
MAQPIPIVTRPGPGATFTLPLASPAFTQSPSSAPASTLNSPLPLSSAQLRRSSYGSSYGWSPGREDSRDEKHNELAESLKRSVTIVFWYKANVQPLRLRVDIATFPLLRLSEVEPIVDAYHLAPNTYVDVYNPHARAWEQEQLCAVRSVESQQRVLYRMRRDLIVGLEDSECLGLEAELRLQEERVSAPALPLLYQPVDSVGQKKRSADEGLSPPSSKHHRSHSSQSGSSTSTAVNALAFEDVGSPMFSRHVVPDSETQVDSSQMPMYASPFSIASLHSVTSATTSTTSQLNQDYHYTPHTPISPIQHARSTHNNSAMPLRTNGPVPISSDSSLAMAVTPPTPTLSIQASPISPTRASYSRLPYPQSASNPTPSPTPKSTPLPSPVTLPAANQDREPTPTAQANGNGTGPGSTAGGGAAKAWPFGKYVCEIDAGLTEMEELMQREPALTQRGAFERVFKAAYKKSTFCNHRRVWKNAPQDALDEWRAAGRAESALWNEFVRALEGKEPKRPAGLAGNGGGQGLGRGVAFAQSQAAFGSPQGGVVHLGMGPAQVMRMQQHSQGLGMRREEPMGSLRPPEGRGYLGEWFGTCFGGFG